VRLLKWTVRRKNDIYVVEDRDLGDVIISRTILFPGKSTRGHSHKNQEAYVFINRATLALDFIDRLVEEGQAIVVPESVHHRVFNNSNANTVFYNMWMKKNGVAK
jgi:mannose-6-phosphate isomerase-like protein (cupin superfamily)